MRIKDGDVSVKSGLRLGFLVVRAAWPGQRAGGERERGMRQARRPLCQSTAELVDFVRTAGASSHEACSSKQRSGRREGDRSVVELEIVGSDPFSAFPMSSSVLNDWSQNGGE